MKPNHGITGLPRSHSLVLLFVVLPGVLTCAQGGANTRLSLCTELAEALNESFSAESVVKDAHLLW